MHARRVPYATRKRLCFFSAFLFLAACVARPSQLHAQSKTSAERPKFDAVSIKVNNKSAIGVGRVNLTQPGGHLTASNVSLKFLIAQAYQLKLRIYLSESLPWIDSEHFDVEAEAEGNPTVEQKRLMLQSLLEDRFKLKMHQETRQLPQYALAVSKAGKLGPQLHPHSADTKCVEIPTGQPNPATVSSADTPWAPCGGIRVPGNDLVGQNVTMNQLVATLSVLMDRDVVDRTSLTGTFDLTLHFQRAQLDDASVEDPSGPPSILTALQQQLGLKLESTKGPVAVQVIDHVEEPSPN